MRTLWVSGNSACKEPWCWSGPEGTCAPDQAGLFVSLVNAVSGPARLEWSRRCVPFTRKLSIPWGILWGSLHGSGDSVGNEPGCWSRLERICAPDQAGLSASQLIQSQVPRDWIGADSVFHSPEVLGSRGGSCVGPCGCQETPQARNTGAGVDRKGERQS